MAAFEALQLHYLQLKSQIECFKILGMDVQSPMEPDPDKPAASVGIGHGAGAKSHPILGNKIQFSGANSDPIINFSVEYNDQVDYPQYQKDYTHQQRLEQMPSMAPRATRG